MKKKLGLLLVLLLSACVLLGGVGLAKAKDKDEPSAGAPPTPPAGVYIADYANVVSDADREAMAVLGRELQQKYGVLLICLTEDTLQGTAPSLYAEMVRQSWGLESKDCLLLFIRQGRRLNLANGQDAATGLTKEQLDAAIAPAAGEMQRGEFSRALTRIYHNLVMTLAAGQGVAPQAAEAVQPDGAMPAAMPEAQEPEVAAEQPDEDGAGEE